jgi:hypothetical protein
MDSVHQQRIVPRCDFSLKKSIAVEGCLLYLASPMRLHGVREVET